MCTMREKAIRVSEEELNAVKDAREELYGDPSVPLGIIVERAVNELANNSGGHVQW